jgi:hypothetical protein
LLGHFGRIVDGDLVWIDLALGSVPHDLIQSIVRVAFAAAAEESPEWIAADAIFAPVTKPRSEFAAIDFGMRRFALVELALRADDPEASRSLHFIAC